ncbi:MAG: nucleotidyl transferase AbiEii/AbiGii toxin family protein [Pseudomonadota bacterium]
MYTTRRDKPLDRITLAVLKALHLIAAKHKASYFIIGATARDILMTHVFGIGAGRATRDVDFAIALKDWHRFEIIKKEFIDCGDFQTAADEAHRLYYRPNEFGTAYPLDLIPFGGIEQPGNTIAWPPDMAVVMNVTGYAESLESAIQVDVGEGLIANVVSIPALAALKLLAWNDRGLLDNKDAQDLFFLLRHYHQAGNVDRLYAEAFSILESCSYEIDFAGATLLGYDTRLILEQTTRQALLDVLGDPVKRDRLVVHMDRSIAADSAIPSRFIDQFERGLGLANL